MNNTLVVDPLLAHSLEVLTIQGGEMGKQLAGQQNINLIDGRELGNGGNRGQVVVVGVTGDEVRNMRGGINEEVGEGIPYGAKNVGQPEGNNESGGRDCYGKAENGGEVGLVDVEVQLGTVGILELGTVEEQRLEPNMVAETIVD